MGKPTGFKEIERLDRTYKPISERVAHYEEFVIPLTEKEVGEQGARCMDCGIPYCHNGCPVDNIIPDWNDLVYRGEWKNALDVLHSTNNFPEFTGRVCPAPCEAACTLNISNRPVTIKTIECAIVDKGWEEGWIGPQIPKHRSGKRIGVVGSGPAGMACAQQLARAGHAVTLYEKNTRFGGLLRYGIPDFKLGKSTIDRRISQMRAEGIELRPNTHVGVNMHPKELTRKYDAIALTCGSEQPRDMPIPGRDLNGIHFAMDFLTEQNRRIAHEKITDQKTISAKEKHVIVIGGGDTGSDCVGTSLRQGASSVTQLEILPQPPEQENKPLIWPHWPLKLRTSTSHEEGCQRDWSISTKAAKGRDGNVTALQLVRVDWEKGVDGAFQMEEIEGTEFELNADLVLLAMGFVNPVHEGLIQSLGINIDTRGNVLADTTNYRTSMERVFAAGDMRRGQSLVVWAIREGRQCAQAIDKYLMSETTLPR